MKELRVLRRALEWYQNQLEELFAEEIDTLEGLPSYEHQTVAEIVEEYKLTDEYERIFGK